MDFLRALLQGLTVEWRSCLEEACIQPSGRYDWQSSPDGKVPSWQRVRRRLIAQWCSIAGTRMATKNALPSRQPGKVYW